MSNSRTSRPDVGFRLVVGLVVLVTIWLLLTPFVPSVASSSLHRFHLRSGSFAWWSVQQPIPSMYNFGNTYEVSAVPPDLIDPIFADLADPAERRYINHFPARVLTWASWRVRNLLDRKDRWVTIQSSYRGLNLQSRIHAKPDGEGGYEMARLPDQERGR